MKTIFISLAVLLLLVIGTSAAIYLSNKKLKNQKDFYTFLNDEGDEIHLGI
jgi:hypothetical protein